MTKNSLLVIFTGGILVDSQSGNGLIDKKTYAALKGFQERLGGVVYLGSTNPLIYSRSNDGVEQISSSDENIVILNHRLDEASIDKIKPDIVLFPVANPSNSVFNNYNGKFVFTDDYSPDVRRQVRLVGAEGLINRARITVGHQRLVFNNRKKLKKAAGIQCNGYAAYRYYKRIHPKTHLFFDHRVREPQLKESREAEKSLSDDLRLGFSGRLQELKGVHLFEPLLDLLDDIGVNYTFDIMGEGGLRFQLENKLKDRATFHGFMDFENSWLPFVRENIDLMILPHIQGDSSSTYFESLGAGVPVIGFDNPSLTPLAEESSAALVVPMRDISSLASEIKNIHNNSIKLDTLRDRSFLFMENKSFESIMDGRVEHLLTL